MKPNGGEPLEFDSAPTEAIAAKGANVSAKIHGFADIPDLLAMEIPPVEWLVDGMIARKTITLWAGTDGCVKTFLNQRLAISVATGTEFLGRRCRRAPVLYLDYENPSFAVKDRFELMAGGPIPDLRVWGSWLEQQPPQIGSELLLTIAMDTQPLMIIDPFRYAHGAEENDSTEMMGVMQQLRYCAAQGAAVIVIHHLAKQEGSTGRGSSAIRGAVDVALLQELSAETALITLRCVKNRFGERWIQTIKPDFDAGTFEVADSPQWTRRNADVEKLRKIIEQNAGLSQAALRKEARMQTGRLSTLLKQEEGIFWRSERVGSSLRYFPPFPKQGKGQGKGEKVTEEEAFPFSHPYKDGKREKPLPDRPSLSQDPGTTRNVGTNEKPTEAHEAKCYIHGLHRDWWLRSDGPERVCGRCHPQVSTADPRRNFSNEQPR